MVEPTNLLDEARNRALVIPKQRPRPATRWIASVGLY